MVIGKRYLNDGKSIISLNNIQLESKKKLEDKIKSSKYSFEKIPCIVCNSNEFELLSEKDRYGLSMNTVICTQCGLVQTNPRMTKASYTEFYDEEYRNLYSGLEGELDLKDFFLGQYNAGKMIYEYLQKTTGHPIKNKFVVEIGTGSGGILKFFQDQGNEVFGFDLGSSYIEYGKKQGLHLEIGGSEKFLTLDKKPDIVICSHVVEHFLNPIEELQKISMSLKPETIVYVEVPGIRHLSISYYQDFLMYLQNAHTYHFTLNSLTNCFQKAGYQLIVGNEIITSLFKVGKVNNSYNSDYESTKNFLMKIEKSRYSFTPFAIKLKIFSLIVLILEKTKLTNIAKKIYYKSKI